MRALAFLAIMALAAGCGAGGEYIYLKEVTMHLDGDSATVELNYSLETFARFYVFALGCKYLEPELLSLFGNNSSVKLLQADMDSASLLVAGAQRYDHGFGLNPSQYQEDRPTQDAIARFTVIDPEGRALTYYNLTFPIDLFRDAGAFFKLSGRSGIRRSEIAKS